MMTPTTDPAAPEASPAPPHGLLRDLARRVIPRPLRNLARRPRNTAAWLWQESSYRLGRVPTCRLRDDWEVRCHPSSLTTFGPFYRDEEFREELAGFVARCTPGMALLDVGAHYGLFSLAALRYGGPAARAVAVDPSDQSIRVLQINARLNGVGDRVTAIRAAAGEADGELAMLTAGPAGEHYMMGTDEVRPDALRVPQWTIPSIVARTGLEPTHLKIDVEGFEGEVLRGARDYLRARRPELFLELHCGFLRARGRRPEDVFAQLADCGYGRIERRGRPIAAAEAAALEFARLVCLPATGPGAE